MSETSFRKKVTWFNFLCCLLVVWNHAGNADLFLGGGAASHPLYIFQYVTVPMVIRVNIPCFLMLSAYLFFRDFSWEKLSGKWSRRVRTLLIPYLFWNTLYYAGYLAASQFAPLRPLINRPELTLTWNNAFQAIIHFSFNPVFWFMYQLLLLVALAPFLYAVLKRAWSGAAFLALLFYGIYWGVALPELNLDALVYYSFAGFAALHGKRIAEGAWTWKRALAGALLLAVGAPLCRYHYQTGIVWPVVLYLVMAPTGLWLLVDERRLGEVKPYMTCTFFIYAFHFIPVRLINKICAALAPGALWLAGALFLIMPVIAVAVCYQAVRILRKFAPRLWKVMNGGR